MAVSKFLTIALVVVASPVRLVVAAAVLVSHSVVLLEDFSAAVTDNPETFVAIAVENVLNALEVMIGAVAGLARLVVLIN